MRVWPGKHYPLGATWDGNGVNFAIFSECATAVELCFFDSADATSESQRIPLSERRDLVWHCYLPEDKVFGRFLRLVQDNPDKKIFVHCRYGDDRTGMMIAAYRMAFEGWSAKEARKEMEQFGFHRLVCPSLGPYEKDFPEHLAKHAAFRNLRPAANP
jgi:pullulanase/glycogen debranching enzyme